MGCDIHLVLEKRRADGRWIGVDTFKGHEANYGKGWYSPVVRQRNYVRFAALAGVRGDGPDPRGVPPGASDTSLELIDEWGGDGHSHSWLPLQEATRIWLETSNLKPDDLGHKYPCSHFFGIDESSQQTKLDDYRVVFWFDS